MRQVGRAVEVPVQFGAAFEPVRESDFGAFALASLHLGHARVHTPLGRRVRMARVVALEVRGAHERRLPVRRVAPLALEELFEFLRRYPTGGRPLSYRRRSRLRRRRRDRAARRALVNRLGRARFCYIFRFFLFVSFWDKLKVALNQAHARLHC